MRASGWVSGLLQVVSGDQSEITTSGCFPSVCFSLESSVGTSCWGRRQAGLGSLGALKVLRGKPGPHSHLGDGIPSWMGPCILWYSGQGEGYGSPNCNHGNLLVWSWN